ncbi:MAG TPA: hypothetical protein VM166_02795 [Gemmatimonadaceae bacterium]|nr:hypothetical protein [Gemmatimonadaceae bacterium]
MLGRVGITGFLLGDSMPRKKKESSTAILLGGLPVMDEKLALLMSKAWREATEGLKWNGERWVHVNAAVLQSEDEENIHRGTD